MDNKRYFAGSLAVFGVYIAFDYLITRGVLRTAYESEPLRRILRSSADMADKGWIMWAVTLAWSLLFALVYTKGYEARGGVMEGLRYGFWIGLMLAVPMAFGSFVTYPIPASVAVQWFVFGTLQTTLCGVAMALVYRGAKPSMIKVGVIT